MKQLLHQYASYNLWANKKISDRIIQLEEAAMDMEVQSSFPSIRKTMLHLWDVESIWWQRLQLAERDIEPSQTFKGNMGDLVKELLKTSAGWERWIYATNDVNIMHVFAYHNSKKEHYKQPVYEMLLHLFNHQTYHRGQIVSMFHALSIDKIPATDFILFSRKKLN